MPRQLRVECARAIYHVMSRAAGKGNIFEGNVDRHDFILARGRFPTGCRLSQRCGRRGETEQQIM
jgi:hypothetical protein